MSGRRPLPCSCTPPLTPLTPSRREASTLWRPRARPRGRRRGRPRPLSSGGGWGRFPESGWAEPQPCQGGAPRSACPRTGPVPGAAERRGGGFGSVLSLWLQSLLGPRRLGWGTRARQWREKRLRPGTPLPPGSVSCLSVIGTGASLAWPCREDGLHCGRKFGLEWRVTSREDPELSADPSGVGDRLPWVSGFPNPSRRMNRVTSNPVARSCTLP